jgi:hypothetical protein
LPGGGSSFAEPPFPLPMLGKFRVFCQCSAKCFPHAADGVANVWQISCGFAKHWQNGKKA